MLVLDESTTAGKMLLSASGPLAENYGGDVGIDELWQRAQGFLARSTRPSRAPQQPAPSDPLCESPHHWAAARGARVGLVFNGVWSHWAFATAAKYRSLYQLLYVHETEWNALEPLEALVVPFQSDLARLTTLQPLFERFLRTGRKVAIFGDSAAVWPGAQWESRPVDNAWWRKDPSRPPITDTDPTHPFYGQLAARHCGWHCHGAFPRSLKGRGVIQRNAAGEPITWQLEYGAGSLLASTKDPIVEHGVQQIRHLDNYNDALTQWLCRRRPSGPFTVERRWYAVRNFRPKAPVAAEPAPSL